MNNRTIIALVALAVALFLVTQTFYTVDPTTQVLVRQFGAIVGEPKIEPGLYAKVRWSRISSGSTAGCSTTKPTSSRSSPATRSASWSMPMPATRSRRPRCSPRPCPAVSPPCAACSNSLINSEIRGVLSSVPLHAVLTDQRANLMDEITRRVNAKTKELGVQTVDVRIKRADLPQANSQSVFNRMKTDREREAGQLRAEGDEEKAGSPPRPTARSPSSRPMPG